MKFEEFISSCKEMRRTIDEAERAFFDFLLAVELDKDGCKELLADASASSFIELLDFHHVCHPGRYTQYKAALMGLADEDTDGIGLNGIIQAAKISDVGSRRDALAEIRKWESTNETSISEQSAKALVRDKRMLKLGAKRHESYIDLAQENDRLKEENHRLKEENSLLKAELRALKPKASGRGRKEARS